MKAKPQKLGNTGKVGQVATKQGAKTPDRSTSHHKNIDKDHVGSALGLLNKHFK